MAVPWMFSCGLARVKKLAYVIFVAATVTGCMPDRAKDLAACKAAVMRFYPTYVASKLEDPGTRYIIGCMASHGYEMEVSAADCDSRYPLPTQATCYAPRDWLASVIGRFRRPAQPD
jgi:hypothetical protein